MTTFNEAALEGLATLYNSWGHGKTFLGNKGGGCFWMAANAFHSAIDGMVKAQVTDTYTFSVDALAFFDGIIHPDTTNPDPTKWRDIGFWVDDYGWWGIAFHIAYINASALGYDAELTTTLGKRALQCWIALNECWDGKALTWKNAQGTELTIKGGIPNTTADVSLAGRNSVTNECYWILSYLLQEKNAQDSNDFFTQAETQNILFDDDGFVLQRFLGLPPKPTPNWSWLGDQGLFMYSCYWNKAEKGDLKYTLAMKLLETVFEKKTTPPITPPNKFGILNEAVAPIDAYTLDYACGKGTFLRYLSYLNDDFHNAEKTNYDDWIMQNSRAVWKNKLPTGLFPFYWNGTEEPPYSTWSPDNYSQGVVNTVLHAAGLSAISATLPWHAGDAID